MPGARAELTEAAARAREMKGGVGQGAVRATLAPVVAQAALVV